MSEQLSLNFGLQTCKKCNTEKPLEDFYEAKNSKSGRRPICIECWKIVCHRTPEQNKEYREINGDRLREYDRNRRLSPEDKSAKAKFDKVYRVQTESEIRDRELRRTYGITLDQYNQMLDKQNNVCALCANPETDLTSSGKVKRLAVDHCHKTGKVRGLLCGDCNKGLGSLKDNHELLLKAASYVALGGV